VVAVLAVSFPKVMGVPITVPDWWLSDRDQGTSDSSATFAAHLNAGSEGPCWMSHTFVRAMTRLWRDMSGAIEMVNGLLAQFIERHS
jgi:hypothetical protein